MTFLLIRGRNPIDDPIVTEPFRKGSQGLAEVWPGLVARLTDVDLRGPKVSVGEAPLNVRRFVAAHDHVDAAAVL
ncbi:MAG TPA: hypothetical protein VFG14_07830 [Chthoniobacteraceae bacterium]|nr:hypothetical protein [Chthoniobacteraceae bacterium]